MSDADDEDISIESELETLETIDSQRSIEDINLLFTSTMVRIASKLEKLRDDLKQASMEMEENPTRKRKRSSRNNYNLRELKKKSNKEESNSN